MAAGHRCSYRHNVCLPLRMAIAYCFRFYLMAAGHRYSLRRNVCLPLRAALPWCLENVTAGTVCPAASVYINFNTKNRPLRVYLMLQTICKLFAFKLLHLLYWCRRRDLNPYDVAIAGF